MLYIGLDDTDQIGTPGTGRLARALASRLAADFPIAGVTRHQLLRHASIPFTANNSTNVILLNEPNNVRCWNCVMRLCKREELRLC